MIICDECETVAHCTKHGCIPKQPLGCVNHDCAKCKARPAPVPDAITDDSESPEYKSGWNDCRRIIMEMMK